MLGLKGKLHPSPTPSPPLIEKHLSRIPFGEWKAASRGIN